MPPELPPMSRRQKHLSDSESDPELPSNPLTFTTPVIGPIVLTNPLSSAEVKRFVNGLDKTPTNEAEDSSENAGILLGIPKKIF